MNSCILSVLEQPALARQLSETCRPCELPHLVPYSRCLRPVAAWRGSVAIIMILSSPISHSRKGQHWIPYCSVVQQRLASIIFPYKVIWSWAPAACDFCHGCKEAEGAEHAEHLEPWRIRYLSFKTWDSTEMVANLLTEA